MATRRTSPKGLEPESRVQPDATVLNGQQERALALLVAGNRVGSVAMALGVDGATLWRWTKLRPFRR